ncbi:LamG-like jellyroll fold domain-containing protein [Streptomyces sp. NPDC093225]|uniref:LamG-like jellyroll fold domain-containing protein n=1 Tax=Streptomyces sp. NPDC093225 TaxID=3366034 RepID=UPI0037F8EBBF
MSIERPAGNRLKTYSDRTYVHTTMVRHQGTVIAFALDDERRLYYSVLDLDSKVAPAHDDDGIGHADLDVRHWADDPRPVPFPTEITRAGASVIGAEPLPRVRLGGRVELGPEEVVPDDEVDPFRSGTGRLTAAVPFQVVSDGRHVFVFRQAVAAGHADAVYRTAKGRLTGAPATDDGQSAAVAAGALLCDRFVLAGSELRPVKEVRYRRSRHRTRPATAKDSLGTVDMDDKPFQEPTQEVGFAGTPTEGRFSVLLLPTIIADTRRWQFFVHNAASGRIDAVNVGQADDGLFDTQGGQLWTSPEPEHEDSVLERQPGKCPFTDHPLIPVVPEPDFAESALRFPGSENAFRGEAVAPAGLGTGAYTVEAWTERDAAGGTLLSTGATGITFAVTAAGALTLAHGATTVTTPDGLVPAGEYMHVAAVYDGAKAAFFVDGDPVTSAALAAVAKAGTTLVLGAKSATEGAFSGTLDEVRVWSRARQTTRIAETMWQRLIGDEPELVAYYRFDESTGATAYDQGPHAAHATLKGGTPQWVTSGAPITDSPGIRRDSFAVTGRTVSGGLSAAVYQQQERGTTGSGAVRPLQRQARVLLTWRSNAGGDEAEAAGQIAALDLAIGRDGRLVQLPDVLDLPVVGATAEQVDPAEENRLKAELVALREQVKEAEEAKAGLDADIATPSRVWDDLRKALEKTTSLTLSPDKATDCLVYAEVTEGGQARGYEYDSDEPEVGTSESSFHHLTAKQAAKGGGFTPVLVTGSADATDRQDQWTITYKGWSDSEGVPDRATVKNVEAAKSLGTAKDSRTVTLGGEAPVFFSPDGFSTSADGLSLYGAQFTPRKKIGENTWQVEGTDRHLTWTGSSMTLADTSFFHRLRRVGDASSRTTLFLVPLTPTGDSETAAAAKVNAALKRLGAIEDEETARAAWDREIQRIQTEIAQKEARLGQITEGTKGRSTKSLPMVNLGQDRLGLGWSGALLGFSAAAGSPFLASGGTGHLGLYYRDDKQALTGLFYDTNVDRSTKKLTASQDTDVLLTARDAGVDLADVTIEVTASEPPVPGLCTLTLTLREIGEAPEKGTGGGAVPGKVLDTETWRLLPRKAESLAAALNGRRFQPVAVGTVASAKENVLTVKAGAAVSLAAGDLVTVDEAAYAVAMEVEAGATEIRLHLPVPAPAIAADASVHLVSYTPALVSHTRPGGHARLGSRYVTATLANKAGTAVGAVADGTAQAAGSARLPSWWSDLPGRALTFAAGTTPPALADTESGLSAVSLADNLTVEAWVKPAAGTTAEDTRRIVHVNTGPASADTQFTLAFGAAAGRQASGARVLVAGVGDRFVTSAATVPVDRWTHVAAAYEQSWALKFAKGVYAEAPHASDLNIGRDLTLEAFLRTGDLSKPQGVLSKGRIDDGRGRKVPYQLGIATDGKLVFSFEGRDGARVVHTSDKAVTKDTFHRIAVVRRLGDSREEKKGTRNADMKVGGKSQSVVMDVIESIVVSRWTEISFRIDGQDAGTSRYYDAPDLSHPGPLEIGRVRHGSAVESFTGEISEVRIWNVARAAEDLGVDIPFTPEASGAGSAEPGPIDGAVRPEGLVAHWRFEENEGNAAQDESGSHPARLHGAKWTKNPDPKGSRFRLYVDGRATEATPTPAAKAPAAGDYGPAQMSLGGRSDASGAVDRYQGVLEEVRIWRTARSEEQLLDSMFGRLTGEAADLLAYYPFDDESTTADAAELRDHGPRALHLALPPGADGRPDPLMSTAPISSETPEVRPVFVTAQDRFVQTIGATPAVSEYADLQRLSDRSTRGVLKRAYAYLQDGTWNLITGYKLGDLVSEWVGQAQFAPQLMGYIEGAPPIPAENLIATRAAGAQTYINAATVEFKQADEVVQTLTSGGEKTLDHAHAVKFSSQGGPDTLMITAPLGFGTATPVVETDFDVEGGGSLEFSDGWGDETAVSQGQSTERATMIGLSGGWEAEPTDEAEKKAFIDNGGRRFAPSNTGYALVQSETADVFALRVAHSGAVVSYRMLPNPDIPRDWNLIPFKINPRYVKQGTLDGKAGYSKDGERWNRRLDSDYQDAADYGEYSYYKPREAYRLKRRIVEDQQRRQAFYEAVDPTKGYADPTAAVARELLSRFTGPIPGPRKDEEKQRRDAAGLSRRDIVNTYVWSADGGFFAESTGTTDVVTETNSGSYHFNGLASVGMSTSFEIFGVGVGFQYDASFGGSISSSRSRSKESTRSFSLEVSLDTPGDMQKYDEDYEPVFKPSGDAVEIPGRVDAYRFMTFYLDADRANFEDFYGKVVDGEWLDSGDRNALALKQAQQSDHKPPCWRVLHRVTFVSRKLPPEEEQITGVLEKAMRGADIGSNFELVRRLDPYVDPAVVKREELRRQVEAGIRQALPDLVVHKDTIVSLFADYRNVH